MISKIIDLEKCTSCMKCEAICTNSRVIEKNDDGYPVFAHDARCIYCGHCFAICPEKAISFQNSSSGDIHEEIWTDGDLISYPDSGFNEDHIRNFLYAMRSERLYSEKPVEKEKIAKVIEAMMMASCAGNEQNKQYYVLTDSAKLGEIEALQRQYYAKLLKMYDNPFAKKMAALAVSLSSQNKTQPFKERYAANLKTLSEGLTFDTSKTSYLKGASALIVITYDHKSGMHRSFYKGDATIAATYGILMAKALGLASCWMGLLEIAAKKDQKICEALSLASGEKIGAAFILGYSDTKWVQYPPRGPAKIVWK